jgi:hypothetical protein
MPAMTAQVAQGQEAGRPQPQTTVQGAGHPFITYAQAGIRLQYVNSGNALGGQINQPLVAVPGYIRKFRVRINSTGGSATAAVTQVADSPYSVFSNVQLYDSFGTPLIIAPGYEAMKLIPKYGGQHFQWVASDPGNLPSWTAMTTAAGNTGNATFQSALPLEFAKGIGTLSGANASLLPRLQFTLNSYANFVGPTAAGQVSPVIEVDLDSEFYWLPEGVNIEPPGLGTTCQWVLQQANPTIATISTTRVQLPRFGGYIHTLIFEIRDSTSLRPTSNSADSGTNNTGWGARTRIYVDGVPLWDIRDSEWQDDIFNSFQGGNFGGANTGGSNTFVQGGTIETGVRVLSRKLSLASVMHGLLDTGETFLSTNPGTLIEVEGAPWGTITNSPAVLNVLAGLVVPVGSLVTGMPEI